MDDHQIRFARCVADMGLAYCAESAEELHRLLDCAIEGILDTWAESGGPTDGSQASAALLSGTIAPLSKRERWTRSGRLLRGVLAFVPVNTGAQGLDGTVLITPAGGDTLARGDRVVLYSQSALQPDTRIRVVEQLLPAGGAK